ncbi:nucleoside permease [bacterium]|nr:nucleoside permease [bacterium]
MSLTTRIQLSIMMFLEFFIWGACAVTLATYLGKHLQFSDVAIGGAYSTWNWAAIVSPFFIGMVADRFFPAQVVLGILHLLGAVLMYWASQVSEPGPFFWVLLAYTLTYMPTLALVNAISFHQMTDVAKQFPGIRVMGTIGWIVAGLAISYVVGPIFRSRLGATPVDATRLPLYLSAAASLALGLYSFTLPHTPPKGKGRKVTVSDVLSLRALALMKDLSFSVFVIGSLLICIPLAFYYTFTNPFLNEAGMKDVAGKMTMGQMSEVLFMLVMPFFFVRLGVKRMLLIGMAAWAIRYLCFAFGTAAMPSVLLLYLGIILHGICYDFFFVTGQIYVDKKAPEEVRAAAQGFIALVTYGAGMVIGNFIAGIIVHAHVTRTVVEGVETVGHNWQSIWLWPCGMAVLIIIAFALLFHENNKARTP